MALDLNGTSQYVDAGNPVSLQITGAITIGGWVKTTDTDWAFIEKDDDDTTNRVFALEYTGGPLNFYILSPSVKVVHWDTAVVRDGNWHHMVATFVPSTSINLYVDGVLKDTNVDTIPAANDNKVVNWSFGRRITGYSLRPLDGTINDIRIYNRALSLAEIQAIYSPQTRGIDNIVNGLLGRWTMNEKHSGATATVASSVIDVSGNGNHGTPVNSPIYTQAPMRLHKPQILTG